MNWDHLHSSPRKESRETCHQNPSIGQTLLSDLVSLKQIVVVSSWNRVMSHPICVWKWENQPSKLVVSYFPGTNNNTTTRYYKYVMYSNTTEVPKNNPCPWFLVVLSPTPAQFYIAFAFALSCVYQYFRGLLVLYGIVYLELCKTIYSWVISMVTNHRIGY